MGSVGLLLGLVLGALGSGSNEHVLISGRVQLATTRDQGTEVDSRRFELTIERRDGAVMRAQACLFADLTRDRDWNGACFPLDGKRIEDALGRGALVPNALAPVDASAQRLLRLIADKAPSVLPSRRILGYDADRDIDLYVARFPEANL